MSEDLSYLTPLLDIACDRDRPADESAQTEQMGIIMTHLERIAAGVGALALIAARKDDAVWEAWMNL